MKKMKLMLMLAIASLLFVGCDKNDEDPYDDYSAIIGFESAQLLSQTGKYEPKYDNILWGVDKTQPDASGNNVYDDVIYSESGLGIGSYYNDFAGTAWPYDGWGGFAVSSNVDKENKGSDYSNQFAVYASGATKFAIGFDMGGWNDGAYERPTIVLDKPAMILSAKIANSNKAYHYCIDNPNGSEGSAPISFTLIATGFNGANQTGQVSIQLAEGSYVQDDWKTFSFMKLGKVDKVVFSFESNDNNAYGDLVPAYFCIDDIKIR